MSDEPQYLIAPPPQATGLQGAPLPNLSELYKYGSEPFVPDRDTERRVQELVERQRAQWKQIQDEALAASQRREAAWKAAQPDRPPRFLPELPEWTAPKTSEQRVQEVVEAERARWREAQNHATQITDTNRATRALPDLSELYKYGSEPFVPDRDTERRVQEVIDAERARWRQAQDEVLATQKRMAEAREATQPLRPPRPLPDLGEWTAPKTQKQRVQEAIDAERARWREAQDHVKRITDQNRATQALPDLSELYKYGSEPFVPDRSTEKRVQESQLMLISKGD